MFAEHSQAPPSPPSAGLPNPFAGIHTDPRALLAYANVLAAYAQQQMQQSMVRQHPVAMSAPQFGAEQQPSSPIPKLQAAKRAPCGSSLRTLIVCVVIGAAGGFYARGQLLPQQLQPSQQLSRQ
jgi:hypothetical protein